MSKEEVKMPCIFLAGQPRAVRESDLKMLTGVLQSAWNQHEVHRALARANKRASEINTLISPTCFTAHLLKDGTAAAKPHGVQEDVEYIPAFLGKIYGGAGLPLAGMLDTILQPALDALGNPLPRRLRGMTAARQTERNKVNLTYPVGIRKGDFLLAGVYSELGG